MSVRAATDASEFDAIEEALQQEVIICADPDFSNFARERAESSFALNQVWAIYDCHDGMPRSYVRVKKVCTRGFKLKITWLDPFPVKAAAELNWGGKDLPVGCGRYQNGETEITVDRLIFSHQMDYTHQVQYINGGRGGSSYFIYPKTGETWALFKEWDDVKGSSKPKEKHRFPCQFEFVEALTDFSEDVGVVVAYLEKMKGFVSIFQKANSDDVLSFCIPPSKLYRFSHRVPSVRMSGKEREGVPAGSFEFDTRALPSYFASLVDTEKICTFINVVESGPENGNSALESCPKESIGICTDDRQVEAGQQAEEQVGNKVAATCNQFLNEKRVIIQAPSKVMLQNNAGEPPDDGSPHRFYGSDAMPEEENAADAFENKPKEVKVENAAGVGGGPIPQKRVNGNMHIEAGKGVPVSTPDAMKRTQSGKSESAGKKRCHKLADEPSKNFDKRKAQLEENDVCAQISGSRSSSQKQQISYKENLSHPDFLVPPTKKRLSGNNSSNMTNGDMKESTVNGRVLKEGLSAAFATSVLSRNNKEVKQKASSSSRLEEMSSNKKSKLEDSMSKAEEASSMSESNGTKSKNDDEGFKTRTSESEVEEPSLMSKSGGTKSANDEEGSKTDFSELDPIETLKPEIIECADPDFTNFDTERSESSFNVSQVWAIYDSIDGMPRLYARVERMCTRVFKLKITWLDTFPDKAIEQKWCNEYLPVACGRYENGETEEIVDRLMFSHRMICMHEGCRYSYLIYPRWGETWALFKDWDMNWSLEPEKHRSPYQYEFVEVLTDFSEKHGVEVAYLEKVKGFVSVFQKAHVLSFRIMPSELYRFSHRVPSVRVFGKEREGVPEGSFEFDTAALPSNLAMRRC